MARAKVQGTEVMCHGRISRIPSWRNSHSRGGAFSRRHPSLPPSFRLLSSTAFLDWRVVPPTWSIVSSWTGTSKTMKMRRCEWHEKQWGKNSWVRREWFVELTFFHSFENTVAKTRRILGNSSWWLSDFVFVQFAAVYYILVSLLCVLYFLAFAACPKS